MAQPAGDQVQVQIKADEMELVGQFSNLVMFHHTAEEFTVHFIYVFPNVPQGKLVSSVIVSPAHAKRIMHALEENIRRYEMQFGPIREVPEPTPVPKVGFVQSGEASPAFHPECADEIHDEAAVVNRNMYSGSQRGKAIRTYTYPVR